MHALSKLGRLGRGHRDSVGDQCDAESLPLPLLEIEVSFSIISSNLFIIESIVTSEESLSLLEIELSS